MLPDEIICVSCYGRMYNVKDNNNFIIIMNNETQNYIISILGLDSVISLTGLLLIIAFTQYDSNLILALIPVVTTPVTLLGGFLTGKTLNEVESETIRENILSKYDTVSESEETSYEDEGESA